MGDYEPISCASHSELELHILRRRRLSLHLRDGEVERRVVVLPVDIGAVSGAEYLYVEGEDGARMTIRLDAILDFQPV